MVAVKGLFIEAEKLPYSESGMVPVPEMMNFGFFPGGRGTYDGSFSLDKKNIMVLGQDFGTESYYKKWRETGESKEKYTRILNKANVDLNACFFTNAYMGLRNEVIQENDKKVTMTSPLTASEKFREESQCYFIKQIDTLNPRVQYKSKNTQCVSDIC